MEFYQSNQPIKQYIYQAYLSQFRAFDYCDIGEISKQSMLIGFNRIDSRINEEWLTKFLTSQGLQMPNIINLQKFISIMEVLRKMSEDQKQKIQTQFLNKFQQKKKL